MPNEQKYRKWLLLLHLTGLILFLDRNSSALSNTDSKEKKPTCRQNTDPHLPQVFMQNLNFCFSLKQKRNQVL